MICSSRGTRAGSAHHQVVRSFVGCREIGEKSDVLISDEIRVVTMIDSKDTNLEAGIVHHLAELAAPLL